MTELLAALLIALWTVTLVLTIAWGLQFLASAPVLTDCQNCGEPTGHGPLCRPCELVTGPVTA